MLCSGANEGGVAVKRVKLFGASDEVRQRELFFQLVAAVDKFMNAPRSFFSEAETNQRLRGERLSQKREILLDGRLRKAESF